MTDKAREEFETAYVESLILRCGEGFRETALYSLSEKRPDGEYQHYPDSIAWWAWQASRAAIVVELPKAHLEFDGDAAPEMFASEVIKAIEAAGLKVKP